jgi:carbonic anhydrase
MISSAAILSCAGGVAVGFLCMAESIGLKRALTRSVAKEQKAKSRKGKKTRRRPLQFFKSDSSQNDFGISDSHNFQRSVTPGSCGATKMHMSRQLSPLASSNCDSFKRGVTEGFDGDDDVMAGGWEGFSMAEALQHADSASENIKRKTPQEVLAQLQRGNVRFWMGASKKPESGAFQRRALLTKQFPSVAVLSCSDSRVPTEILFDMGLGDMFVVRVAGNILDSTTLGSLQYAVKHLKVKVLLVMGHEGCGAVKAAGLPPKDLVNEPAALQTLLGCLGSGMDFDRLRSCFDKRAADRESVVSNIASQLEMLTMDGGIMTKVRAGELIVIGGFYELSSGIVDFFSEVTAEIPSTEAPTDPTGSVSAPTVSRGVVGHFSPSPRRKTSGLQFHSLGKNGGNTP